MSTIGKVFLLLNLFLAGGFLFWASTELGKGAEMKKHYEDQVAALTKSKTELESKTTDLNTQLGAEKGQKEQFRNERDHAQSESNHNKEELAEAKRANDQLGGDVAKIQSTLAQYQTGNDRLTKEKDAAIARAHQLEMERDDAKRAQGAAEEAKRTADESLVKANRDIADLEKKLKSNKDEMAKLDTQLKSLIAMTGVDVNKTTPVEQIDAKVVQVDYSLKPGLVALSAGSNSGVKRGYTFEIYSGTTYKGQVRVETVHPDMSSALIVFSTPNQKIGPGDSASTRL